MTEKSLSGKVVRASKWLAIAQVFLSSLTFVSITILARILSPEDFGLVAIASIFVALVQAFAKIPVGQALIRLKSIEDAHFDTAFTVSIIRTGIIGILIAFLAETVSNFYGETELELILYVLAIATIISGFTNPKFILFEKDLDFKKHFITSSLSSLVVFVTSITIAVITESYWALVFGNVAGQIINIGVTYFLIPYLPKLSLRKFRDVFSFALWLSLSNLVNQIQWNLDQIIIGKFLGASPLGIFNIGARIATLPSRELVEPLMRTFYPAFSNIHNDLPRLTKAFLLTQSTIFSVTLPLGVGLALFAEEAVRIIVGDKWLESIIVVQIVAISSAIKASSASAKALAMSLNKTKWIFNRDLVMILIHIPAIIIGFMANGIFGILIARISTTLIITAINFQMIHSLLDKTIFEQLWYSRRTFISLIPMVLVSFTLPDYKVEDLVISTIYILIGIVFCACSYILTHYILWLLEGRPEGPELKLVLALQQKFIKIENINKS